MHQSQRPVIITSILLCLLVVKVIDVVADRLYSIDYPKERSYPIEGVEAPQAEDNATAGPGDILPLIKTSDIERGKKVAQKCVQCHAFTKDGGSKVGPNLWGILGAKFAHMAGYSYSKALQSMSGQWDVKSLNEFLYKPNQFVKGTKMSFAGLKNPQERVDLIAYMNTMGDSPQPLK